MVTSVILISSNYIETDSVGIEIVYISFIEEWGLAWAMAQEMQKKKKKKKGWRWTGGTYKNIMIMIHNRNWGN